MTRTKFPMIGIAGLAGLATALALIAAPPAAAANRPTPAAQASPLHPTFLLLDASGVNVLESGEPASTMQTCGACHDAAFISEHNAHAGQLSGEPSGPAGELLIANPETGELVALDPAAAEVEMNCFVCHTAAPNNTARLSALLSGQYAWANTATLAGTGIVVQEGDGYIWNSNAFDEAGSLLQEYITIQDPTTDNCGLCHGVATTDALTPLALDPCATEQRTTLTTGQVFSPQLISDSGLNLSNKEGLIRTWDVHAERLVGCTDCHYSLNNPAYAAEASEDRPEHLLFDPRRLEPGEYLAQPLHELARSDADPLTGNACTSCHEVRRTHTWLPYTDRHMEALACETCHVPRMEAPARQSIDWTVLATSNTPSATCRGIEGEPGSQDAPLVGYQPVVLPRDDGDGATRYAPYNLIATWTWVYGDPPQPVSLATLRAAYFEGDTYAPDVLAAFDTNGDSSLARSELVLDADAKEALIAGRLEALGLSSPRIAGQVDAYPIHHGVTHGDWAIRDCQECHDNDSRLAQPMVLASSTPGSAIPTFSGSPTEGSIAEQGDGRVLFQPSTGGQGSDTYIFGHSRVRAVDWAGAIVFLGVLAGVFGHGGLRVLAARRRSPHTPETCAVYMYGIYERLWHWLQTGLILLLIFTGLVIHRPDMFGIFSFSYIVLTHNVLAGILVINAALAAFYHLASGEIRQYLPKPTGFFGRAFEQAIYYTRGIFRGEIHPFEKTPDQKLNPLQQITYLGLLNVLLPLQVITGALMWGAQQWPDVANRLGGLPLLAPIHTLIAWLFASFVVMHVYLTTTGPTPLASIRGMVMGWDEVEAQAGD